MSKEKVEGFLFGLGAGVLVACFLKPFDADGGERRSKPKEASPKPAVTVHK